MNCVPEIIKEKEDEEHFLPYRCCMHRDIQLFLTDVLSIWSSVIKCASKKNDKIEVSKIDSVLKMFSKDYIIEAVSNVKVFEYSDSIDINRNPVIWANAISGGLKKLLIEVRSCDKNSSLANCIATDLTGDVKLEKTGESIKCIYDWINKEYSRLIQMLDEEHSKGIYKVTIKTYFQ